MTNPSVRHAAIEPLEARIAPAGVISAHWQTATFGAPIALHAGDGLSTAGAGAGTYLLYVEKGDALVFLTDLNNNGNVDFNEVTGIAAGDGLRLTSFVDIHGDIATNLVKTAANVGGTLTTVLTLSDSDNNGDNDPFNKIGDGRVLLNQSIEKIELRSLTVADLPDQNNDGVVDDIDVALRKANTTYSIFGSIYAGKSFGVAGGGLIVDSTGATAGLVGSDGDFGFASNTVSSLGTVRTGTAASSSFFNFGVTNADDISGTFVKFTPPKGQAGGDIISVHAASSAMKFNLSGLFAGDGGIGARGGNVQDVTITQDDTGGYQIVAGNGGRGPSGGAGGSIVNLVDLGSTTGKVVVQTGDGGAGATGVGGSGGNLTFQTFNVFGTVGIELGSGGDGFRAGGNGAALTKGVLSQATATAFVPGNAVGTMHHSVYDPSNPGANAPEIGAHQGVDFNGDGFGDFVYTSKTTSQLIVQLGDGFGGFKTVTGPDGLSQVLRYHLSGARNAEALTVGDFNGDGHPDIAVGSYDAGSQAGIVTFLAKYEDVNSDGNLTSDEDLNHNGVNDFVGFSDPRYSVLPQLDRGDPSTPNDVLPSWQSPHQISSLVAGDFDGDGKTELAAVVTFYGLKTTDVTTGVITGLAGAFQTVLFLSPDQEFNNATGAMELTGQFYADFGTKQKVVNNLTIPADPKSPFFTTLAGTGSSSRTSIVIEASALTSTADHDVLFVGIRDAKLVRVVDYQTRTNASLPTVLGSYALGKVDTDRDLTVPANPPAPAINHVSTPLADVTLEDFTVADYNNDGAADLGVISSAPLGFLVGVRGDGTGAGVQSSGFNGVGGTTGPAAQQNDNAGNFFYDKGLGIDPSIKLLAIESVDINGDGSVDDFVVLTGSGRFFGMHYQEGPQPTGGASAVTTGAYVGFVTPIGLRVITNGPEFLDGVYLPLVADQSSPFFATDMGIPPGGIPNVINYLSPNGGISQLTSIGDAAYSVHTGDGGDSVIGKGGIGGAIGSGAKFTSAVNATSGLKTAVANSSVSFLLDTTLGGSSLKFVAGNGGDGFSSGGKGGSISGVLVGGTLRNQGVAPNAEFEGISATLVAGDGGRGVSAAGGDGGDLAQNSIQGATRLFAGDGGVGRTGGNGGDVLGNNSGLLDASNITMTVIAGNAGDGDKKGGVGGNITNFHPYVGDPGNDLFASFLDYQAGTGGDARSGAGGAGGSITNSSPLPGDGIQGEILAQAGDGGTGLNGGVGGSIKQLVITPAGQSLKPEVLSFIAGQGGNGTSGNGGVGGSVTDISVPTRGVNSLHLLAAYNYSRILGGDGGASSGGKGGKGGDLKNIDSGSTNGSFALVAGAGGKGLTYGGDGGDVLNADLFLPASAATKALVVAGIGGDATSFITNPQDGTPHQGQNAFGGRPGKGGNGGNISGFTQSGSIGFHADLVAGNGGNTINYGSIADITPYVGTGGSIMHVKLEGDFGNVTTDDPNTPNNENLPIKSYNNILAGETMAAWVNANIRGAGGPVIDLNDNIGNVGIIVGAAGRNKAVVTTPGANPADPASYKSQPAQNAINGSLIDIEARNIMSAVAGNVDLIASIQVAKDIRVLKFVIGADKGVIGQSDYLDPNGNPTPDGKPVLDGRLVDGAFIAKKLLDAAGKPTTLPGRVFNL